MNEKVRKYFEWSWNYAQAELLVDETIKDVARSISAGISRGEDQTDEELVLDFLLVRTDDVHQLTLISDADWKPNGEDDQPTWDEVVAEILKHPNVVCEAVQIAAEREAEDREEKRWSKTSHETGELA